MYKLFPRDLGTPRRHIVYSKEEMIRIVNAYNGLKNLYLSVYKFDVVDGLPDYKNPYIDKIFFDFDSHLAYKQIIRVHEFLSKKNVMHMCVFSGGGFHIYIKVPMIKYKHPKGVVKHFQEYILKKNRIPINIKNGADPHIIGDTSRISRIINTLNLKHRKFCVCLPERLLKDNLKEVYEYAKKQQKIEWIGDKVVSIKKFDKPIPDINIDYDDVEIDENGLFVPTPDMLPQYSEYYGKEIRHYVMFSLVSDLMKVICAGDIPKKEEERIKLINPIIKFFRDTNTYNKNWSHTIEHIKYIVRRGYITGNGYVERYGIYQNI